MRDRSSSDVARLARILSKRALSLSLSGGAARGFAHLGVLRALEESGVEVDGFYGTSMGSLIAAGAAMGWPARRISSLVHERFVGSSIFDFTVPLISGVSGQRFDAFLAEAFGDRAIEDLWRPFACVSCDLVTAKIVVMDRGPLRTAVRASSALTGIFPPVVDGERVLVDGAFLDNLPAAIAMERTPGRSIAVNVIPFEDPIVRRLVNRPSSPPWFVLANRLNPFASAAATPTILDLGLRSFFLPSVRHAERVRREVELHIEPAVESFGFLEMGSFDAIVAAGYKAARAALNGFARDAP